MSTFKEIFFTITGGLAAFAAFITGAGLGTKYLWNNTITVIFETNPITFWQSIMLLILANIIFGNEYTFSTKKKDKPKKFKVNDIQGDDDDEDDDD